MDGGMAQVGPPTGSEGMSESSSSAGGGGGAFIEGEGASDGHNHELGSKYNNILYDKTIGMCTVGGDSNNWGDAYKQTLIYDALDIASCLEQCAHNPECKSVLISITPANEWGPEIFSCNITPEDLTGDGIETYEDDSYQTRQACYRKISNEDSSSIIVVGPPSGWGGGSSSSSINSDSSDNGDLPTVSST